MKKVILAMAASLFFGSLCQRVLAQEFQDQLGWSADSEAGCHAGGPLNNHSDYDSANVENWAAAACPEQR